MKGNASRLQGRLTVFSVRDDKVVPFPQQRPAAGARRGFKEFGLRLGGALNGGLEVLEGAVGDLAENRCRGGLWSTCVSARGLDIG